MITMKPPKEPRAMAEVHEWRKKLFARAKGKTLNQKMVWISKQAKKSKVSLKTYVSPLKSFKKAS